MRKKTSKRYAFTYETIDGDCFNTDDWDEIRSARRHKQLHREDGPALICRDGTDFQDGKFEEWYVDGKLHREDGPAVVCENGREEWCLDDRSHRLSGPARTTSTGQKKWYINGKALPKKEVEAWLDENEVDLSTEEGQFAFKLRWS